ncbi:MAG: DNA topoisomerase III [Clostridia bacterium]|nr:DNA topoisomerase III [Clostridia bacterium]
MKLVITEKPSVARTVAAVLGASYNRKGYYEGSGWIIAWCFGHLAGLADAAAYDPAYLKWRREDLPIFPDPFRFTVFPGTKEQYDLLCSLMNRPDVEGIVNACDAGREGELIFRTVYDLSGCRKPVERLWISSMELSAIREGFENLRFGEEYKNLHRAALCRAEADWLVGINASRFFSLLYGVKLNVGRVMTPTLALMAEREAEIAAFTSETFYTVCLDCGICAVSERIADRESAERLAEECHKAVVRSVEKKKKTANPPLLYDLTTLQRDANKNYGYTAQQTLDALQSLYEKRLCTYPRTDSRYLTDDMEGKVPEILETAQRVLGRPLDARNASNAKALCDSRKVSDHHAVIPTESAGYVDPSSLTGTEKDILYLVASAVVLALGDPFLYEETTVLLECAGQTFTAKGKTVIEPGWMEERLARKNDFDDVLPALEEGQILPVRNAEVKESKTVPPKRYTEDTLLAAMENAGSKEMPKDAERRGLGTPATRAAILEKLIHDGFLTRKKAQKTAYLVPTEIGKNLIAVLPEELQSPVLTAEWEHRLGEIERGERSPEDFLDGIRSMLRDLIGTYTPVPCAETLFPSGGDRLGTCPRCGGAVKESVKGYFCENRECTFGFWKENRLFDGVGKRMDSATAAALLNTGRAELKGCCSRKTGNRFDCTLVLCDDGKKTDFRLEFHNNKAKEKES